MSSHPPSPGSQWATLTVRLRTGSISLAELAESAHRLDDLASVIALDEAVSGVETRDPQSGHAVERPELVIYTQPAALPALKTRVGELARRFELTVDLSAEVRDDEDWKDTWKQFYRPLRFGRDRLLVRPSWIERRPDDPAAEILIDPGRAFGTGLHQSTQLCLERLCMLADARSVEHVLDLGCGSGILALAAARLWPRAEILAIDIDPEATETARENAAINRLEDRLRIATGELESLVEARARFDLVIANIRPEILVPLESALRARVLPQARVTLSGILDTESSRVLRAYEGAGWHLDDSSDGGVRTDAQWCAIDLVAPSPMLP